MEIDREMKRGLSFCTKESRNAKKEQTLQDFEWRKCKVAAKNDGFCEKCQEMKKIYKWSVCVFSVCVCVCLLGIDEKKMQVAEEEEDGERVGGVLVKFVSKIIII